MISSMIGVALVPLIITYLLEVYSSLRARNSRGLEVQLHSAETGDAAVDQLWRGTLLELKTLITSFAPNENMDSPPKVDEQMRGRWSRRYTAAVERLPHAGIKINPSGSEEYIILRTQWDGYITSLAPKFAYHMDEVDTALAKLK